MIFRHVINAYTTFGFKCYADAMTPNNMKETGENLTQIVRCAKDGKCFLALQKTLRSWTDMVNGRPKHGIALTKTLKTLATKFTTKKTVASYRTQKTSVR